MSRSSIAYLALTLAAWLSTLSCGLPGAPQPPSLELPNPAGDLTATREGNRVVLRWTPSVENTDGSRIRHPGITRLCRTSGTVPMQSCIAVGSATPVAPAPSSQIGKAAKSHAEFVDTLPEAVQQDPSNAVTYAVELLNAHRKSAGLSNQVTVAAVAALSPPGTLSAAVQPRGIVLSWPEVAGNSHFCPDQCRIRVERRLGTARSTSIALLPITATSYEDSSFEWQRTYQYAVRPVISIPAGGTTAEVPGDESPVATVFADDVFPPPQPVDLQAVFSGAGQTPFIDLVWSASSASDLAGYNVYRRQENGTPVKVNSEMVKAPAYRDTQVEPGKRYFYSVTAVDLRGNESRKSAEASESVPTP